VEDDGDNSEEEESVETMNAEALTPHLSLQAIHDPWHSRVSNHQGMGKDKQMSHINFD
jgi:hypothetical protein